MKKVILFYLKPYYGRMTIGFIIKFIGTIMDLCLPWIPAYMIDTVIPQGTHKEPMEKKGFCHRLYKAQFE